MVTMTDKRSEEYNGWTNRETWCAALWINNDQGMQEYAAELARRDDYGDAIRDMVDEIAGDVTAGHATHDAITMILDIGSLWRVDWREIRNTLLEP